MKITNIEKLHQLKEQYKDTILNYQQMMQLDEDFLLEMAVIEPSDSGLPYELWLDPAGVERGNEHTNSPRLKVKVEGEYIPFEISENPDIPDSVKKQGYNSFPHENIIKKYIIAYRKALLAHYFKEIKDRDIYKYIGTLKQAPELELKLEHDLSPTEGRIEYHWDDNEMLYEINVVSEDNTIVSTSYAFNDNLLYKEINSLKYVYDINNIINADVNRKKK